MKPLLMPPNVSEHFYRGGSRLARLRGYIAETDYGPEDWLAATVTRNGEPRTGLSQTADGELLRDLIAADPINWLGKEPTADNDSRPIADTGILVKLLDADQRLPVHVHPDRQFAQQHLHSCYGKTEAWFVLETAGDDPAVWLGFREDIDPQALLQAMEARDSGWLLDRMHKLTVRPGDGILVPAGTAHAIGAGVFVVEAQEPTDFSVLVEWWVTTEGITDAFLGIDAASAMSAVTHRMLPLDQLRQLVVHSDVDQGAANPLSVLPPAADRYFRVDMIAPAGDPVPLEQGFSVVIVLAGTGELRGHDETTSLEKGQVYAVPHGAGSTTVAGTVRIMRVRPGTEPVVRQVL